MHFKEHLEIITMLKMLDYQHLVNWINNSAKHHSKINDLSDQKFNQLNSYLVQSISYLISTNIELHITNVKNSDLQTKLIENIKALKEFSLEPIEGEQVYHFIALWSSMRKDLLSDFGINEQ